MRAASPLDPPSFAYRILRPPICTGLRAILWACGGIRVTGSEHVPRSGGVLIVSNHLSVCDPPVVALSTHRYVWFLARAYLFDIPVLSPLIKVMRAYPVDPREGQRSALRHAANVVRAGEALVIYPEGHCSPDGTLGPFHRGAALVAWQTRAPVVPFAMAGTQRLVPVGRLLPRPAETPILARFGPPLDLAELEGMPRSEWVRQANDKMREAMVALTDQPPIGDPGPCCASPPGATRRRPSCAPS